MKNTLRKTAVGFLALSLTSLISVATPPDTGIQGQAFATIGPVFIGPPPFVAPPSVTLPVATSFTIVSARSGKVVGHFNTDSTGAFKVPLRPGGYLIVPDPLPRYLSCLRFETIEVSVRPREHTWVVISYYGYPCHFVGTPQ